MVNANSDIRSGDGKFTPIAADNNELHAKQGSFIGRIAGWLTGRKPTASNDPQNLPSPDRAVLVIAAHYSIEQAVEAFFNRCEAQNLAKNTLSFYRYRFAAFRKFLYSKGIDVSIDQIMPRIIRDFMADERTRVSEVTAQKSFIALRVLFNFMVDEGALSVSPMVNIKSPKVKKKIIPTFSTAQIRLMLQACGKGLIGDRNRAIIWVLYDCGLRVSELCSIRLEDINWSNQTIRINGKGSKERLVRYGSSTKKALQAYMASRAHVTALQDLFVTLGGEPMDRQGVDREVKACGEQAGIIGVRVSPHTFRHSFAVNYIRNGGDVFSLQKILGHSSLEMTRRYTELAQSDVIEKHQQFSPGDSLGEY